MCNLIYDIPLTLHIGCTFIDFSQKSIESTALLCVCLETGGRSVQHSQSAIHCQTWMYHRVGCHHKSGQAFCFVPLIQGGFKYTECNPLLFTFYPHSVWHQYPAAACVPRGLHSRLQTPGWRGPYASLSIWRRCGTQFKALSVIIVRRQ